MLCGTGVTIIIIAHRYSTLINTDRIIELILYLNMENLHSNDDSKTGENQET